MNKKQQKRKIEQPHGATDKDLLHILDVLFYPEIKRHFPQHFLHGTRQEGFTGYLERHIKEYPYYLHFEIKEFYPELSMKSLYNFLLGSYKMICRDNVSVFGENYLYNGLRSFFDRRLNISKAEDKCLSIYLIPYVLLGVCSLLEPLPFLCTQREFLVFLPQKSSLFSVKKKITKELLSLGLKTGKEGFTCGNFATDPVAFSRFCIEEGKLMPAPGEISKQFLHEIATKKKITLLLYQN